MTPKSATDRPEPLNPSIPGHGSPAGEPVPTMERAVDPTNQWQKAAPGRAATVAVAETPPKPEAEPDQPASVGATSRDTPPPEEGAPEAATQAKATKGAGAAATAKRPARPAAKGATPGKVHAPAAPQNEELVDAITRRLADNLAKALRQSVVEAVEGTLGAPRPPAPGDESAAMAQPPAQATAADE